MGALDHAVRDSVAEERDGCEKRGPQALRDRWQHGADHVRDAIGPRVVGVHNMLGDAPLGHEGRKLALERDRAVYLYSEGLPAVVVHNAHDAATAVQSRVARKRMKRVNVSVSVRRWSEQVP